MDIQIDHWYLIKSTENAPSILWVQEIRDGGKSVLNRLDNGWVFIPAQWKIEAEVTADSPLVTQAKKKYYERTIKVTVETQEIFIEWDGYEVVKWIENEWIEEPKLVCPVIANAVHLAYTNPEKLIKINWKHIESQMQIEKENL